MPIDDVAVATMTWARSADEEAVLLDGIRALAALRLPTLIADRGGNASFEQRLQSIEGVRVCTARRPGLTGQVTLALDMAVECDRPWIFYVEPDKTEFFRTAASRFLREAPRADDAGIAIAARSDASMATYPPMQRYTEGVVNHLSAIALGTAGDYCYGPFLLRRSVAAALGPMDGLGWGWRPYAFRAAVRLGLRIEHLTGDYPCPPGQRDEDAAERVHRMRQLSENIQGLIV